MFKGKYVAGVPLEKVIRKIYKMFRRETSMRKPFFIKATCSSTKKEFLHRIFLWKIHKILKNGQKKHKSFQKNYLPELVSMNIFTDMF